MKIMKLMLSFVITSALTLALGITSSALWFFPDQYTVQVRPATGMTCEQIAAIELACAEWNTATLRVEVQFKNEVVPFNGNDKICSIALVSPSSTVCPTEIKTETLGYAYAGYAYDGDILINPSKPFSYGINTSDKYSFRGLVAHELGHILGIDHSDKETFGLFNWMYGSRTDDTMYSLMNIANSNKWETLTSADVQLYKKYVKRDTRNGPALTRRP